MTLQLKTVRASWGSKHEIGNHGNECESIKMYMSRWDEINFTSKYRFRKSWSNSWE